MSVYHDLATRCTIISKIQAHTNTADSFMGQCKDKLMYKSGVPIQWSKDVYSGSNIGGWEVLPIGEEPITIWFLV